MSNSKFGLRTRKGLIRLFVEGAQAVLFDADALAYITANTAITSTADKNAINTFFLGLKSDGIYTKMKAMYLPIWGTSANCKFNLVAPNGSYDLTFTTGWTFSSGGMTPSNAYANTSIIPRNVLSYGNSHASFYNRTNSNTGAWDHGAVSNLNNDKFYLRFDGANNYTVGIQESASSIITTGSGACFIIGTMTTPTTIAGYKNGVLSRSDTVVATNNLPNNANIYLGACSYGPGINAYGFRQYAFSSVGDGLTATQATNLSNRVNTLMTHFGINVY